MHSATPAAAMDAGSEAHSISAVTYAGSVPARFECVTDQEVLTLQQRQHPLHAPDHVCQAVDR